MVDLDERLRKHFRTWPDPMRSAWTSLNFEVLKSSLMSNFQRDARKDELKQIFLMASREACLKPDGVLYSTKEKRSFFHSVLKMALKNGVDPTSDADHSPLGAAISRDDLQTVRLLLSHGANPNDECLLRRPLHSALRNMQNDIAKELLNYGADPNVLAQEDPVWFYTLYMGYPILPELFSAGADIHATSSQGCSALHCYVDMFISDGSREHEVEEIVGFLLEKGIDFNAKDKNRLTSVEVARKNNRHALADLMLKAKSDYDAAALDRSSLKVGKPVARSRL